MFKSRTIAQGYSSGPFKAEASGDNYLYSPKVKENVTFTFSNPGNNTT